MKARGRLVVLACAAVVLLALPAGAAAKPGYYIEKPVRLVLLHLAGSNGYRIHIVGFNSRQVQISASKNSSSASYNVRGTVTDDEIRGRFGSRGRIAMRFEPQGPADVDEVPSNCKGKPSSDQNGRFVGLVYFEGEDGFTRVRAKAARGFVLIGHRAVCKRGKRKTRKPRPKDPRIVSLSAISSDSPKGPWYSVYREGSNGSARFAEGLGETVHTASVSEKRPGMSIFRWAGATSPPETFAVSPLGVRPVTATVSPPAPFSGTATYEKALDGSIGWSGDLAAELPGRGEVSFTDPTYRAHLCRSFACACPVEGCLFLSVSSGRVKTERLHRLAARVRP